MEVDSILALLRHNVLQLIDSFNQGGSELQALQLTRLLHDSGRFHLRVACLNPNGILRSQIDDLNLPEIPSYPLNSFYDRNALVQLRAFVQFLRASKIDILHTHDFYTNIFGTVAGALARIPVRIASRRETLGMRTSAQIRLQRIAYSLASQIVANSEAVREQLIREGLGKEKTSVIYNGIDLERVVPSVTRREDALSLLGLPMETENSRKRFVTIVANMRHDVKDYPMFLRAAKRIHETMPEVAFLLAGKGKLSELLRALSRELRIESASFFIGRCEHIAELLSISEVCVLSSKAEGFSNSILEYMAAARPVVATNVGGVAEVIVEGETGYLVSSGDDQLMATQIMRLLKDPERARKMGESGRRVVEEKFSCDAQLKNTEALYERLLRQTQTSAVKTQGATTENV